MKKEWPKSLLFSQFTVRNERGEEYETLIVEGGKTGKKKGEIDTCQGGNVKGNALS